MNWGHKITLAFVAFVAFIMYMVVVAFQQDIDLVSDDYYAQEISYQDKMQQKANYNALTDVPTVKVLGDKVEWNFPGTSAVEGTVYFYHPSKENLDKKVAIDLTDRKQNLSTSELASGLYRVNLSWKADGKEYFHQESIYVQ